MHKIYHKKFYNNPIIMPMIVLFLSLVMAIVYRIIIAINSNPELASNNVFNQSDNYGATIKNKQKIISQNHQMLVNIPNNIKHNAANIYRVNIKKGDYLQRSPYNLFVKG